MLLYGISPTGRKPVSDGPAGMLFFSACYEEHNSANERRGAQDGRQRNVVRLFASSVNRADVDELFPGGVRKASPHKTEQSQCNQNDSERFVHGHLLRQR